MNALEEEHGHDHHGHSHDDKQPEEEMAGLELCAVDFDQGDGLCAFTKGEWPGFEKSSRGSHNPEHPRNRSDHNDPPLTQIDLR